MSERHLSGGTMQASSYRLSVVLLPQITTIFDTAHEVAKILFRGMKMLHRLKENLREGRTTDLRHTDA
jgi:hypothetical protein